MTDDTPATISQLDFAPLHDGIERWTLDTIATLQRLGMADWAATGAVSIMLLQTGGALAGQLDVGLHGAFGQDAVNGGAASAVGISSCTRCARPATGQPMRWTMLRRCETVAPSTTSRTCKLCASPAIRARRQRK